MFLVRLLSSSQQPSFVPSPARRSVRPCKTPKDVFTLRLVEAPGDPGQRFPTDDRHTYLKCAFNGVDYPVQQSRTCGLGNGNVAVAQDLDCGSLFGASPFPTQEGPRL
jgi:hypothetical protein